MAWEEEGGIDAGVDVLLDTAAALRGVAEQIASSCEFLGDVLGGTGLVSRLDVLSDGAKNGRVESAVFKQGLAGERLGDQTGNTLLQAWDHRVGVVGEPDDQHAGDVH